jgi:hypothetical protein
MTIFQIGDEVTALWPADGGWYPAVIEGFRDSKLKIDQSFGILSLFSLQLKLL